MMVWGPSGPWKRIIVYREAVDHDFPMPHPDVLEQFIDYQAPLDRYDELAMYDGSVIVERTKGEMSARCDKEGANFLALNLAHEVATGRRTVEDARRMYGEQIKAIGPSGTKVVLQSSGRKSNGGGRSQNQDHLRSAQRRTQGSDFRSQGLDLGALRP